MEQAGKRKGQQVGAMPGQERKTTFQDVNAPRFYCFHPHHRQFSSLLHRQFAPGHTPQAAARALVDRRRGNHGLSLVSAAVAT